MSETETAGGVYAFPVLFAVLWKAMMLTPSRTTRMQTPM